jgi:hypothetical protein
MQENLTANLTAGWNYLPVLNACDNNVEDLFAPVIGHVQIVKEVAGWGVYWPQYGVNTLGDVVPGKAYFVLVDEDVEVEFAPCTRSNFLSDKTPSNSPSRGRTEPASQKQIDKNNQSDNSAVRSSVAALRVGTPLSLRRGAGGEVSPCVATPSPEGEGWGEVLKTPLTHTIAFPETILEDFEEGDFITIYNQNGLLCGAALVQNQNLVLTAFGDDPTTPQVDGLTEGEAMQFRVFNPKTGKEFPLEVKFDESLPQGGYFVNHGLSAVKGIETTGLEEMATSGINLSVYPNPSTGIFHVETQSGFETLTGFAWEISNTHGSIIAKGISQSNDFKIDISKHPKGIYYLKISQEELQTIKKLVLQ